MTTFGTALVASMATRPRISRRAAGAGKGATLTISRKAPFAPGPWGLGTGLRRCSAATCGLSVSAGAPMMTRLIAHAGRVHPRREVAPHPSVQSLLATPATCRIPACLGLCVQCSGIQVIHIRHSGYGRHPGCGGSDDCVVCVRSPNPLADSANTAGPARGAWIGCRDNSESFSRKRTSSIMLADGLSQQLALGQRWVIA
jgi:hypothetical protein